ncbi:nucleotidyl transferase AbiEii/AbiGii toxin family protein [Echinicola marina]|uniref:nucleotidyl transferase AbiEii/AbiGii toxin family protein n=1 Tax=Echinicola marina TaxID=2859768 RepID=UPI001CF6854C|nr:nucleotidyl transferase AbiEii/AbiGii toxin family protein [Echinicola marina]UCS94008.1 nucleotidyl transferase AbiEii/AbiGii toxin family protein [Echinicola marina]
MTFYELKAADKLDVCQGVENDRGIPAFAVEKDWWVVQTLEIIFGMDVASHLVFKGGTSLSKAWKLIDRFSEDINLAIDRDFLGFKGDLGKNQRTKLRKTTSSYIEDVFFPELRGRFMERGMEDIEFRLIASSSSDQDPRIIEIFYPNATKSPGYILPRVQVEIGCRSLREPFENKTIASFISEQYPKADFAKEPVSIPSVLPERTFLEKLFLLHEEFQRPTGKIRVERLSRHLYDIHQLSRSPHADRAIHDHDLYEAIVDHRHTFTRMRGIDYNLHQPQTIQPLPIPDLEGAWMKDYKTMREQMIYGDSPSYQEMISGIQKFLSKLNNMEWTMKSEFPRL